MTTQDADDYLARLEPRKREALEALRRSILDVVPDAEEALSDGAPAFRTRGKLVAGFAAAKHHLSYLPHSGTVLAELNEDLAGYGTSKGCTDVRCRHSAPRRARRGAGAGTAS